VIKSRVHRLAFLAVFAPAAFLALSGSERLKQVIGASTVREQQGFGPTGRQDQVAFHLGELG